METEKQIYCSLDIETSGFDPLKNEVLEVGLAFFTVDRGTVTVTDEWTKVFRPKLPVPAQILSLTGISQHELDQALPFEVYKEQLQAKLRQAIIIGHNVIFDIKFLQSLGIQFSGKIIDTLDLVQFILPTHHSYNLENLMHYFKVDHANAHRALADAKASIIVLEGLLGKFCTFPEHLQQEVFSIAAKQEFVWVELMQQFRNGLTQQQPIQPSSAPKKKPITKTLELKPKTIYCFTPVKPTLNSLLEHLSSQTDKILLVVPKSNQVMQLWKDSSIAGVFSPEQLFNQKKIENFCKKDPLTPEEAKFILKIKVWQQTNWQHESILDLNFSFFGGQFKEYIIGGVQKNLTNKLVCCDLATFFTFPKQNNYNLRTVVIVGLYDFEQSLNNLQSIKVSWSYCRYLLKTVYDSQTGTGNESLEPLVTQALEKADLFFGLVHALLYSEAQAFQYYKIDDRVTDSLNFQRIKAAAENFTDYLLSSEISRVLSEISNFARNLNNFFIPDMNQVRWIELAETRCVFYSMPLDIAPVVQKVLAEFNQLCFADSLGAESLLSFFVQRLGVEDFTIQNVQPRMRQGDLFSGLKNFLHRAHAPSRQFTLSEQAISQEQLAVLIKQTALPTAVLFPSQANVQEFHNSYYEQLKKYTFLLAQTGSGGLNKLFNNFSIHDNTLLLTTTRQVLKTITGAVTVSPLNQLSVKTLIICNLPFESYTHPYQQAVSTRFEKPFEQYSLPQALYNLHALLQFFNTDVLQNVYIYDPKLAKGYAKIFKEYIGLISNLKTN